MNQLDAWATWRGADPAVKAIHAYLRKKTICHDLIAKGILPVYSDGSMVVTKPEKDKLTEETKEIAEAPVFKALGQEKELVKTVVVFELERKTASTRRTSTTRLLRPSFRPSTGRSTTTILSSPRRAISTKTS